MPLGLSERALGPDDVSELRDEAVVDLVDAGYHLTRVFIGWATLVVVGSIVLLVDWQSRARLDAIAIALLVVWLLDTIVLVKAIHHHAACSDSLARVDQFETATRRRRSR